MHALMLEIIRTISSRLSRSSFTGLKPSSGVRRPSVGACSTLLPLLRLERQVRVGLREVGVVRQSIREALGPGCSGPDLRKLPSAGHRDLALEVRVFPKVL